MDNELPIQPNVTDNLSIISAEANVEPASTRKKYLIIVIAVVSIVLLLIFIILGLKMLGDRSSQISSSTSSGLVSSEESISSTTSSSLSSIDETILDSLGLPINIRLASNSGVIIDQKGSNYLVLRTGNNKLLIESTSEEVSDTGYSQKQEVKQLDVSFQDSQIFEVPTRPSFKDYFENTYSLSGESWYSYVSDYREDNCPTDIDTGEHFPACGTYFIKLGDSTNFALLHLVCITNMSSSSTCDSLIEQLDITR